MKKIIIPVLLTLLTLGVASAKTQMTMPLSAVLKNIHDIGYKSVYEAKLKHGVYKIEALDSHQQAVDVTVNAQTGQLIPAEELLPKKSMLDIVKPLEKAGNSLYSVDLEHDGYYEIKMINSQGQKQKIRIDANAYRKR